jgi:Fe-S cluster assembly protein SufD
LAGKIESKNMKNNIPQEFLDFLQKYRWQDTKSYLLVFVDGDFHKELSDSFPKSAKVQFEVLQNSDIAGSKIFLHINENSVIRELIRFLIITTNNSSSNSVNFNNQIIVDAHSEITLFEEHVEYKKTNCITNIFTQLNLGEHAKLKYFKKQLNGDDSTHFSSLKISFAESSSYYANYIIRGSKFIREQITAELLHEKSLCEISGLYFLSGDKSGDFLIDVIHKVPNCQSQVLFKGVINGTATADFVGKIFVAKNCDNTKAHLTNKNLLLSESAEIKTAPQLEIYTDNIECSHGATVGQLDEDSLFYLCSRGIDFEIAKTMLIDAFAAEVTRSCLHFY